MLAEDFGFFGLFELLDLLVGQRLADVGEAVGEQVDRVEPGAAKTKGGFESGSVGSRQVRGSEGKRLSRERL